MPAMATLDEGEALKVHMSTLLGYVVAWQVKVPPFVQRR